MRHFRKNFLIPGIFLLLLLLVLPAGAGPGLTASLSVGPATTQVPPQEAQAYLAEANAAIAGQNWTKASLVTTAGLAWYPKNADLLCVQAYSYRKTGQINASLESVSRAIRLDPAPVRYANRGYGYLALGNYTAALADAEAGIALNATYPPSYTVKALALSGLGRDAEARAAIGKAIDLGPGSAHSWHVSGILQAKAGNCTGSREALERSVSIDPGYSLPWPGFSGAEEDLAALDRTCVPPAAATGTTRPLPTKSSPGAVALAGILVALVLFASRK
jgi:tetratricopeptide (TPR) repeat protein